MSRTFRRLTLALGAAILAVPALTAAQGGRMAPAGRPGTGPMGRGAVPGGITALLNARRQLDLTPRQVAQLDSLERVQFAERRQFAERMRPQRDSLQARLRQGQRGAAPDPALRDSLRAQARARQEANRPLLAQRRTRDSALNAAAERVLNDAQRQKLGEMRAERRGFERGLRAGRGERAGRPPTGIRGGMRRPPEGAVGPRGGYLGPQGGVRGPQGPGMPGGRGGMPPRRPPAPDTGER